MPIGPIMLDIAGTTLSEEDIALLQNPMVGGVILFARNYKSPEQLTALTYKIRHSRKNPLLIAVDQEGGRIQRFQEHFTKLPALASIGELFDESPERAVKLAVTCGWLMAIELLTTGVDFSFAPVLDLNKNMSEIIGNRSFHANPEVVTVLAKAYIQGMNRAGMQAIGKHFPGHGSVAPDSHVALPIDDRASEQILESDIIPFARLARQDLAGMMTAHIIFPKLDAKPVTFSSFWLQKVLRKQTGFTGAIFSDDLTMEGAAGIGNYYERSIQAIEAGCDMILLCNNREAVKEVLAKYKQPINKISHQRLLKLCGRFQFTRTELANNAAWHESVNSLNQLTEVASE
jgi:beta-N-acetylhexosaminidase